MFKLAISKPTWVMAGVSIAIGLSSYWFFSNFTKTPVEKNKGYSVEARRNPYLAAEKFLNSNNIEFEQRKNFKLFDAELAQFDSVMINGSRIGMLQDTRLKMKQWVEKGGHLILLATEVFNYEKSTSRDQFLDNLGLRYYSDDDIYYDYDSDERITKLKFDDYEETTWIDFYPQGYLDDTSGDATFTAGSEQADYMVQYQLKEGLVTILADFKIWNNYNIEQQDHAIFLQQLAGTSPKVWFIYHRIQPSLMSLAFDQMPYVIISATVLLVLILFSNLWRQGALKPNVPAIQRKIMQHIQASGTFHYYTNGGQYLIQKMITSLNHKIEIRAHEFSQLSDKDKIIKINQLTAINKKQLHDLYFSELETHDDFVSKVKLIQQIRKHL